MNGFITNNIEILCNKMQHMSSCAIDCDNINIISSGPLARLSKS